jgi:hypothetical protein
MDTDEHGCRKTRKTRERFSHGWAQIKHRCGKDVEQEETEGEIHHRDTETQRGQSGRKLTTDGHE